MAAIKGDYAKNADAEDKKYIDKFRDRLSNTTKKYGKWINSIDDHEDHPGQALVTRDHDVIRNWAEDRNAKPATISTTRRGKFLGVLRFNFPGFESKNLENVTWEEWLQTFDNRDLAFIFQEHLKSGKQSNFFQLDNPHREQA